MLLTSTTIQEKPLRRGLSLSCPKTVTDLTEGDYPWLAQEIMPPSIAAALEHATSSLDSRASATWESPDQSNSRVKMLVSVERAVRVASSWGQTGYASSQTDDRCRIRLGLRKLSLTQKLSGGLGRKEHVPRPEIASETPSAMVSNV